MTTLHTVSFQKTVLASLIGLCLSQSVFALQEISDESSNATTGEGTAFLPKDFSFRFHGADTTNTGQGTYEAGYIHLIPVGALTTTTESKAYQKKEIYRHIYTHYENIDHSTISIGTATRDSTTTTNLLDTSKATDVAGISFDKVGKTDLVNSGSTVIDGLLIQQMKITTTEL